MHSTTAVIHKCTHMCDCVCVWVFVIYSNLFLLKQKKKNLHHATANMHRTVIKLLDGERGATRTRVAEREEKVWQKQRTASNKTKTTHNTYTHTTDEWNRKWFLFDFRCMYMKFTWLLFPFSFCLVRRLPRLMNVFVIYVWFFYIIECSPNAWFAFVKVKIEKIH